MGKGLSIRKNVRELCVLIPLVGAIDADLRVRRGDIPLIYQAPNEDGRSNLEVLVEGEKRKNTLYEYEREIFRYREHLAKSGVFLLYHALTTGHAVAKLYPLIKGFFD